MENAVHRLSMEERSSMALTGIDKVISFEPEEVILISKKGRMKITGKELHVTNLDIDRGIVDLKGHIDTINYSDQKGSKEGSMLKRMFR